MIEAVFFSVLLGSAIYLTVGFICWALVPALMWLERQWAAGGKWYFWAFWASLCLWSCGHETARSLRDVHAATAQLAEHNPPLHARQ
jgi:hypothetical protein